MSDAPLALAVAAGMLAALNPCGFALLPAYLGLLVARTGRPGTGAALGRALAMAASMTVGFVAVFGLFGLVVVPSALSVEQYLPWVTVAIGVALVSLGGWLLSGRELLIRTPRLGGGAPGRTAGSMVIYGVAYAVASLSCTVGPFLAVTTTTFRGIGLVGGLAVFVAYALGMGLVVGTLAVAVALAQDTVVARTRRLLPYVSRASGALLVLAGAYVTHYGVYELRVFAGGDAADPVIDAALRLQGWASGLLSRSGPAVLAAVLAALVAASLLLRHRRRARTASPETSPLPR